MTPEIIVMLTHHDVTVANAAECFKQCADLPVTYWGFKDNGLTLTQMERLVRDFRDAGKVPVLEVVSSDHDELENAAILAVASGIEHFTGARFSDRVMQRLHEAGIRYFPFCGDIGGPPITLNGSIEAIIADARHIRAQGADGIDLVAWRYVDGDPVALAKVMVAEFGGERIIIAGSINSAQRLRQIQEIGAFACTMGGALFEGAFVPDGSFRDNLEAVIQLQHELKQAQEGAIA